MPMFLCDLGIKATHPSSPDDGCVLIIMKSNFNAHSPRGWMIGLNYYIIVLYISLYRILH